MTNYITYHHRWYVPRLGIDYESSIHMLPEVIMDTHDVERLVEKYGYWAVRWAIAEKLFCERSE